MVSSSYWARMWRPSCGHTFTCSGDGSVTNTTPPPPSPNDPPQQPGPLRRLGTLKGEHAAPVCGSGWFGGIPDAFTGLCRDGYGRTAVAVLTTAGWPGPP